MPIIVVPAPPIIPPVAATSSDGHLTVTTDPVYGGVLLAADFSALLPAEVPQQVRFVRGDGSVVRSGHNVWSPGGVAYAYDFEMPLGVVSSWRATPRVYDVVSAGFSEVGGQSDAAAVFVPDLSPGQDFMLKSVSNPTLNLRLTGMWSDPEFGLAGRDSLVDLPRSEFAGGSWDVPTLQPVSYVFRTVTLAERDALLAVLRSGPLLVQILTDYGIADGFYIPASVSEKFYVGKTDQSRDPAKRLVAVTFKPIRRPPTAGSPLYIPGRSYSDVDASYASYTALNAAKASYTAIIDS